MVCVKLLYMCVSIFVSHISLPVRMAHLIFTCVYIYNKHNSTTLTLTFIVCPFKCIHVHH